MVATPMLLHSERKYRALAVLSVKFKITEGFTDICVTPTTQPTHLRNKKEYSFKGET